MAYGDIKYLPRWIAFDKVLSNKALSVAKNQKYDGYQKSLAAMVYRFLDKSKIMPNYQLSEELHQQINRKFEKIKVHSSFKSNTWGVDLANIQLISKYYKGFHFLLCVTDIYSKYAWIVPLKDKKDTTIANAFWKL